MISYIPTIRLVISSTIVNLAFTTNGHFGNISPFTLVGSFAVKANSIGIGNTITAATVTIEVPNFVNDFNINNSFNLFRRLV